VHVDLSQEFLQFHRLVCRVHYEPRPRYLCKRMLFLDFIVVRADLLNDHYAIFIRHLKVRQHEVYGLDVGGLHVFDSIVEQVHACLNYLLPVKAVDSSENAQRLQIGSNDLYIQIAVICDHYLKC
jgi:hypothetical protein